MGVPYGGDNYSTLEVAPDILRHGDYPEVVPPSAPEAHGYYSPKLEQTAYPSPSTTLITANPYPTDPEVAYNNNAGADGSKGAKICGIQRKYFWFALAGAVLIIIGVVVGAVVGSTRHNSGTAAPSGAQDANNGSGSGSGSGNNNTDNNNNDDNNNDAGPPKLTLYEDTRLASANFTDAFGHDNFLLVYQLSDASICMSAFNSSNKEWVVSTVVNGTEGIKLGASLALNTFWQGSNSPDISLYYQGNDSAATIKSLIYSSSEGLSTTSVAPSANWQPLGAAGGLNSLSGSSLVSYGKQCEFCNQFAYFFWQEQQGIYMAQLSGSSVTGANLIDVQVEPSANTSMALTYSGTLNGDSGAILRRSINLFYRSTTSGLTQLRIGNGMNVPSYVGRDIGPRTQLAAFTTGFNESRSNNPTPLGFQVLSIDPDVDDGVQLTYLKDGKWTAATDEVKDLADCRAKATISVNTGRRLYCLAKPVDGAGVEIVEWAWRGDPSDTDTYTDWGKIGTVDVGV
ncbi:hypothetical protein F5Y14DRAFT_403563 [Nemania sp. NC0429]|nr:hypothetical protein F5Y14DRAFT_403563 [Nemania sp. NC0429]